MPRSTTRPVIDDEDLVRAPHGAQAVGDDDGGPSLERVVERPLDRSLALAVEVGGRLVEHDDSRPLEEQPREGDALLLAAGQPVPAIADHGVEAVGKLVDQPADLRRRACLEQLLLGGLRSRVEQVGPDGVVEHVRSPA